MSDSAQPSVLQVFIFRNGEFIGTDIFAERQVVVGRDPTVADLVLESSQVSRKHAILERDGDQVVIRDAGSTNGIYLNNKKVKDSAPVTRLDEVLLGDFAIKIKLVRGGKADEDVSSSPPTRIAPSPLPRKAEPEGSRPKPAPREEKRAERAPAPEPERRRAAPEDDNRPTSADEPLGSKQKPAAGPDLSDWDDVSSQDVAEGKRKHDDRKPAAEFRDRGEVIDKRRFGEMLEGIGITKSKKPEAAPKKPEVSAKKPKPADDDEGSFDLTEPPVEKSKPKARMPEPKRPESKKPEARPQNDEGGFDIDEDRPSPVTAEEMPSDSSFAATADFDAGDDHDDEEDEANFVPPFSLIERMKQDDGPRDRRAPAWVEVLDIQGENLTNVQMLQPGEGYWIGPELGMFMRAFARELPPRTRLLKYTREGSCRIEMRKDLNGTLVRGGRQMKLDAIPELTKDRRRGTVCMDIKDGEALDIVDGWHTYHVRFVPPPADMRDPRPLVKQLQPDKESMRSMIASVAGHVAFAVLMTIFSSGEPVAVPTEKKEEFVEVALDAKQELEEPPPPPEEKQPEPQAAVEKVPESMSAKPLPKGVKPKAGGTSKAPPGVLGLLSKRGSSAAPGPAAAVAAVSNLLAAKGPGGASGGYKVSGLIGKLPSNQLSVGGGGGGLLTKGGAALLRGGGGGGGLLAGGQGKRTVGGLVQKDPKAMRSAGQGTLDRDEIQKVINDNIGAIQRCYERELLKAPGLSGKIQVEWTIATSGSVRSVRQTFTSMNSTNTSNCIMSSIRGWRFPKPRGGEVIVNYPFIFKSIGF